MTLRGVPRFFVQICWDFSLCHFSLVQLFSGFALKPQDSCRTTRYVDDTHCIFKNWSSKKNNKFLPRKEKILVSSYYHFQERDHYCSCCLLYCDCHRKPYFMTTIIRWDRGCFRNTNRYNVYYSCCYHSHCYDFQKQNIPKQSFSIASFILIFISYSPQPSDSQHRDITCLVRDPNLNLYVSRLHLGKGDNPKDITQLYRIIS